MSKYESGERRLDVIEYLDIANNLDLDGDYLIKTLRGEDAASPESDDAV